MDTRSAELHRLRGVFLAATSAEETEARIDRMYRNSLRSL
jgi:hypothetical protein